MNERCFSFFFLVRSPGASCGWQQQEGRSSRSVSPWWLGKYLRLRLERSERSRGVQTAWTQVNVCEGEWEMTVLVKTKTYRKVTSSWMCVIPSGRAVAAGGFGQGKGPVHLDQVRCTGKEEFLGECPSLGQSIQGCRRREDAGVRCDITPRESTTQIKPEEPSCGLRKMAEEDGKRRNQGEENILR